MQSMLKRTRKWTERYTLVVLSTLLPIVLGVCIIIWQSNQSLRSEASDTAQEAVRQFDLMLDNAKLAADVVSPLAGQECEQVTLDLREQVTRRPYVRSVNLVWNNQIYCTSLFGSYKEAVNAADYNEGVLWLMPGNAVTPDKPLLVYRREVDQAGAIVSLYGLHLINVLSLINPYTQMMFQVGNNSIDRYAVVRHTPPEPYPVASVIVPSAHYPYRVMTGFSEGTLWRFIKARYLGLLALFMFLGCVSGATVMWLQKRLSLSSPTHELQRGLEASEFIPYFQPVVRSDTQHWAGAEVLMRWQHPTEGLVRPDLFIPLAEHSGLIVPMTRSLFRQTAELLAPHANSMAPGFHVGFNISAQHCHSLELIDDCQAFLQAFPAGRIKLVLELTERELVIPSAITHQLFAELRAMGVMIALDDFGTGHSSLSYLHTFNVDYLKIDQSFVAMIGANAVSSPILDSIIDLSAKLNLGMVAEGVETLEQSEYLALKGVEFLQGYLYARPLTPEDFIKSLMAQHRLSV